MAEFVRTCNCALAPTGVVEFDGRPFEKSVEVMVVDRARGCYHKEGDVVLKKLVGKE